MPSLIPDPRSKPINEGSPIMTTDDLPKQPLIPPPSEVFISPVGEKIISFITTTNAHVKGKGK